MIKNNKSRGDLTDVSALTKSLTPTSTNACKVYPAPVLVFSKVNEICIVYYILEII